MMLMLVLVVVVSEDYDNVNLDVRHEMVPLRQVGSGHRPSLIVFTVCEYTDSNVTCDRHRWCLWKWFVSVLQRHVGNVHVRVSVTVSPYIYGMRCTGTACCWIPQKYSLMIVVTLLTQTEPSDGGRGVVSVWHKYLLETSSCVIGCSEWTVTQMGTGNNFTSATWCTARVNTCTQMHWLTRWCTTRWTGCW